MYERTFVTGALSKAEWCSLWVNGLIAFGLNLVSFTVSYLRFPNPQSKNKLLMYHSF